MCYNKITKGKEGTNGQYEYFRIKAKEIADCGGNVSSRTRDSFEVVSIDGAEVGELSNATVEKIEDEMPFYRAKFSVASINDDGDKAQVRLNVFECDGIPGHRSWPYPA